MDCGDGKELLFTVVFKNEPQLWDVTHKNYNLNS